MEIRDDLPNHSVIQVVVPDPSDTGLVASTLAAFLAKEELPPGTSVRVESVEEFSARGRVPDCDCQLIQCVCAEARRHEKGCRRRLATTCAVPFSCEPHGLDVCSECDPCSCGA